VALNNSIQTFDFYKKNFILSIKIGEDYVSLWIVLCGHHNEAP